MFEIFEDSDRSYIDIIIARYVRAMSKLEDLCNAINTRGSISNIQTPNVNINPQNIQEALDAIDKHDESRWVIHDPKRLGMHLNTPFNMPDAHFEFLVKLIKPSEIIKMEAAYFEALSELAYVPHLDDIENMRSYDIKLDCSQNGTLTYHIQSPMAKYDGEITIPLDIYDIDQLNSSFPYINTVLPGILERIAQVNPTHIDELISNCIFQKYNALMWSIDDPDELVTKKLAFIEHAKQELSQQVIHDLHTLFVPLIPEFQKFLNPTTIEVLNEFDDRPVEEINAYVDLMYKRAVMIQQIPMMIAELPTSEEVQQPSNKDLTRLSLDELEHKHHELYQRMLSLHPNLDEVKQNINIVLNQIAEYAKIKLTLQEQWFTQYNVFEKQIDEAFMPSTYVRIYDEMTKACAMMKSTLMNLEINYKTRWNQLIDLAEQFQLPLVHTSYLSSDDLLQLTKPAYDLEIEKLNTILACFQDGLNPLDQKEMLSDFIDVQNIVTTQPNGDNTISEQQDNIFQDINLDDPQSPRPSEASSGLLHSFLGFFKPKPEPLLERAFTETELRQLKDICRAPYEAFLLSKANKTIKEEKITVANQAIQEIEQSQSPSEILKAIDKSIMDAGYAKISWLGAKTGELVKATMLAKNNFNTHIETLQKKSSQTP